MKRYYQPLGFHIHSNTKQINMKMRGTKMKKKNKPVNILNVNHKRYLYKLTDNNNQKK